MPTGRSSSAGCPQAIRAHGTESERGQISIAPGNLLASSLFCRKRRDDLGGWASLGPGEEWGHLYSPQPLPQLPCVSIKQPSEFSFHAPVADCSAIMTNISNCENSTRSNHRGDGRYLNSTEIRRGTLEVDFLGSRLSRCKVQ